MDLKGNYKGKGAFDTRFSLFEIIFYLTVIIFLVVSLSLYIQGQEMMARDRQRIKDVALLQQALQDYFQSHQKYPPSAKWSCLESNSDLEQALKNYLPKIPKDPRFREIKQENPFCYHYKTVNKSKDYKIYYFLENNKRFKQVFSLGGKGIYTGELGEEKWYNQNWHFRQKIFLKEESPKSHLDNFPLFVKFQSTELQAHARADGRDIIFTDKEGRKLDQEILSYNPQQGELQAFVKIPSIFADKRTEIFVYYGNPKASQENGYNVFDKDFLAVYHLDKISFPISESSTNRVGKTIPAANVLTATSVSTSLPLENFLVSDSSLNKLNGVLRGWKNELVAGKVFRAFQFNGQDNYINLGTSTMFSEMPGLTVEAWIFPQGKKNMGILGWEGDSMDAWQMYLSQNRLKFSVRTSKGVFAKISTQKIKPDSWNYVAATFSPKQLSLFLNGKLESLKILGGKIQRGRGKFIEIGRYLDKANTFQGKIDEVRISKVKRTNDWLQLSYLNQLDPEKFCILSPPEID